MKNIVPFVIVCLWISIAGCCSSESSQKSTQLIPDTTKPAVFSKPAQSPAIVQNVSRVDAVIDALTIIDNTQYSLTIFVVKSEPVSGRFSLIEPEQRVTIYPEFVFTGAGGVVDGNNPRNKKLLALREAQVGQSFRGKITIDQRGLWRLIEVEDR